jgi:hypothetical protein
VSYRPHDIDFRLYRFCVFPFIRRHRAGRGFDLYQATTAQRKPDQAIGKSVTQIGQINEITTQIVYDPADFGVVFISFAVFHVQPSNFDLNAIWIKPM